MDQASHRAIAAGADHQQIQRLAETRQDVGGRPVPDLGFAVTESSDALAGLRHERVDRISERQGPRTEGTDRHGDRRSGR